MRRKKRWTDAEVEKLRSMVGKHSQDQIAQELGRPRGSVSTKASELNLSLVFHRRRQKPASMDPGPAGMDLTGWTLRLKRLFSMSSLLDRSRQTRVLKWTARAGTPATEARTAVGPG